MDIISLIPEIIALVLGYFGVFVMTFGCGKAIWMFLHACFKSHVQIEMIRLELGQYLALGLEFLVGKDIIETIISPTWDDLGKLGAIVILRTFLNFYLTKEIEKLEHNENIHKIILKRRNHSR